MLIVKILKTINLEEHCRPISMTKIQEAMISNIYFKAR